MFVLAPWTAKPFETLSEIYDHQGDPIRALQYELLAAHLTNTGFERWMSLGETCEKKGDNLQAVGCYIKGMNGWDTEIMFLN